MIKTEELRLGICLKYRKNKNIKTEFHGRVEVIDKENLCWLINHPDQNLFEPIPLTAEILTKAGFDTDQICYWKDYSYQGTVEYLTLGYYAGKRFGFLKSNQLSNGSTIEVKYFHQLQNLYFALTGEELEVKELNLEYENQA